MPLGPEAALRAERSRLAGLRRPPSRSCRRAKSPCSSCATSSDSTRVRWPACSTRPPNRSTARSSGPAPACSARLSPTVGREPPPAVGSPSEDALVAQFARAWESADVGALVDLLTDDVFISMPPDALRVRGPRRRGPLLRRPVRRGPQVRPRAAREPTASRRSARTCEPRPASATGPASTCSPSPATGSAP